MVYGYLKEWLGWLDYIESVEDTAQNIKARLKAFAENGGSPNEPFRFDVSM